MSINFISKNFGGDPITWATAKKLISKYNKHDQKWTREGGETLSAFRIELTRLPHLQSKDLEEIQAKYLLIVPGYNDGSISNNRASKKSPSADIGFTTILMLVDTEDNIITSSGFGIVDFLDTIPPKKLNKVDGQDLHEIKD